MVVGFSPQFSFAGKVVGALAIGQLVTNSSRQMEPSTSRKTKVMVLHELRSPLHGIIGLANTLSQEPGPIQKPTLAMIGWSAERVLDLATNMMDYWNLAEEPVRSAKRKDEVLDLAALAKDVVTKSESFKDKRGKPLKRDKVNLKTDLEHVTISADSPAVQQMLSQIVTNALKFTAEGEVCLSVREDPQNDSAIISVRDTGIGIKPESVQGMLDAFQQEDSSESRKYDGIGLGLAIVREVVRIHSGRCEIKPSGSKGTVVTVTLPRSQRESAGQGEADASAKIIVPAPGMKPRGAPSCWLGPSAQIGIQVVPKQTLNLNAGSRTATSLPSLKEGLPMQYFEDDDDNLIMSVDDDFVNQEVMRSILEPCGFKVVACMNGSECLEYLDGNNPRPRLMLLDLMMPGLSGFDVLQALQKKCSLQEFPVVMVSAKNQSSSVVKGYELGCTDWIHKPFCRQELIARVKAGIPNMEVLTESLAPVFQEFEALSAKCFGKGLSPRLSCHAYCDVNTHRCKATILAMLTLWLEMWDKLLLLAQKMLDITHKASMCISIGLHTETSVPAILTGNRQYPNSSFFSNTLQKAKLLCDVAAENRIILSRSARCRLSADVEAELQQSGLRLLLGSSDSQTGEFYYVARSMELHPQPLKEAGALAEQPQAASPNDEDANLRKKQMAVQELQEDLLQTRNGLTIMQQQLTVAEEQMMQAKAESQSLRVQLQARQSTAQPEVQPEVKPANSSASLLFLQWQNAHLQAEIRHYQSALSNTKAELQMQIMAGQLLESKHSLLQARVEHLELDLAFKAAYGGQEEGSDWPSAGVGTSQVSGPSPFKEFKDTNLVLGSLLSGQLAGPNAGANSASFPTAAGTGPMTIFSTAGGIGSTHGGINATLGSLGRQGTGG
ncbi:unnamed protein product [Effrenium voratum]|uniref:histidine kinase n=1 Tax=Effrenium voratum TaxID=2562239 RepID=A0AA36NMX9_9DINO|nr:unnamed protein product [Effrenium voratum]